MHGLTGGGWKRGNLRHRASPLPSHLQAQAGKRGARPPAAPPAGTGCPTGATGRRPAPRRAHRHGRRRRGRRPGPGRSPPRRGGRVDTASRAPADARREAPSRRPGRCRRSPPVIGEEAAPATAPSHRPRAPQRSRPEPVGEVAGLSAEEHIDRPASAGNVDQHRAVVVPAAQRELVDAEHPDSADRWIRQRADHPQQRRPAHPHPQPGGQPRSGPPGQRERDRHQCRLQADASAGVPLGQSRDLLDEGARAAVDVVAEEPAHRQPHLDRPPGNGQIRQVPPVPAVHPRRHPPAPDSPG